MSKTHRLLLLQPGSSPPVAAMALEQPSDVASGQIPQDAGFVQRTRQRIYRAYHTLLERLDYQERICSALRHVETLEIHHSAGLSEADAQKLWRRYLNRQQRRHRVRLTLYTVLAVLGLALIPIPGPNVFSLYPAALALGRYLALRGIGSVRQRAVISFHPEPLVDDLEGSAGRLEQVHEQLRTLEERFGVTRLGELLTSQ